VRSAAPSDPLAELIEQRRRALRDMRRRTPQIVVARSFSAAGFGSEDVFLGTGLPLYVDAIVATIRAPLDASQPALTGPQGGWSNASSNGVVVIEVFQPHGALDGAAPNIVVVARMEVPVHERATMLRVVRAEGGKVEPLLPLLGRVRVAWPNKEPDLPAAAAVYVDVTVLFAVTASAIGQPAPETLPGVDAGELERTLLRRELAATVQAGMRRLQDEIN
jgi:hypothetical protein